MVRGRADQISELLALLHSDDLDDRLWSSQILGEIGDAEALQALRERLALVNQELTALIVAVAKLKKRLGVK